jgi:hypothetical protein
VLEGLRKVLTAAGWQHAEDQREMFASRTDWSLAPNQLSEMVRERQQHGLPLIDLTESNPTRCGFVYNPEEILGALVDSRALTYEPDPRGLLSARRAVVSYYTERGVRVDAGQVFLTTSTSEAYSYVFRLLADSGDAILVPEPSYPLFDFLGGLNDVELVPYPLIYDQGWEMDLPALEARLGPRVRAILLVHPNNPTGSFVRRSELKLLIQCCQQRGLALVADEVFADYGLVPDDERVVSHASVSETLTFTLSGLSKISGLPQMKLAWLVASGPRACLQEALARLEVIADTYLSVSAPLAYALPKWLEYRRTLQPQILERVRANLLRLEQVLAPGLPVSCGRTDGGWYAILKLPSTRTDEAWALDLLSYDGVLVHPGHFFDFRSDGHLVVSLLPPPGVFEEGIRRILARVA